MSIGFTGFASAALQLGLEATLIRPTRGIFNPVKADGSSLLDIVAQATIEETHQDDLEVTEHPVEQGAAIVDHAFKRPAEVIIKMGWSNSPSGPGSLINAGVGFASAVNPTVQKIANAVEVGSAVLSMFNGSGADQIKATYQKLLELQSSRALFDVYTGKRVYRNMICKSLSTQTDFRSENTLFITITCKQMILVNTETVAFPKDKQANPAATSSPVDKGTKTLRQVGG